MGLEEIMRVIILTLIPSQTQIGVQLHVRNMVSIVHLSAFSNRTATHYLTYSGLGIGNEDSDLPSSFLCCIEHSFLIL